MTNIRRALLVGTALVGASLAYTQPASATPTVGLQYSLDNGTTWTNLGTSPSTPGASCTPALPPSGCSINFTQTINGLSFNSFGVTSNTQGLPIGSDLQWAGTAIANGTGTAKSVWLRASATDYTAPLPSFTLFNNAGSTSAIPSPSNALTVQAFLDPSDTLYGTTLATPDAVANPAAPSSSISTSLNVSTPLTLYSLTQILKITVGPKSTYNPVVSEAAIATPEPASLALLGTGIAAVGALSRRRARKA